MKIDDIFAMQNPAQSSV